MTFAKANVNQVDPSTSHGPGHRRNAAVQRPFLISLLDATHRGGRLPACADAAKIVLGSGWRAPVYAGTYADMEDLLTYPHCIRPSDGCVSGGIGCNSA
jgi:hypothetical protein